MNKTASHKKSIREISDEIIQLFQEKGQYQYGGESVNQLEHALQSAAHAQKMKLSEELVIAALLHDLGHLLDHDFESSSEFENDSENHTDGQVRENNDLSEDHQHEILGDRYLQNYFGPELTEPVRLHVAAKRFLCTKDESYYQKLSHASILSLKLQGGKMSDGEMETFLKNPYAQSALQIRACDDEAKVIGKLIPPLEAYRPLLEKVIAKYRTSRN